MDLHIRRISEETKIATTTVRVYLSRPEFNHIRVVRGIYYGIFQSDLDRLKKLYYRRQVKLGIKTLIRYKDYYKMLDINDILGAKDCVYEQWVDLPKLKEYPLLQECLTKSEYNALAKKKVDYIVFKLEE